MKPIKNYPGYFVSRGGDVISKRFKKPLCKLKHPDGYVAVCLFSNGKGKYQLIHRIVATTYLANPNNLLVVNHKNGQRDDNRVENLEWASYKENTHHILKRRCICPVCGTQFEPHI